MKIRSGFVSNSSSSSFVCDITGESMEVYSDSLLEYDVASCVNNHSFIYRRLDCAEAIRNFIYDGKDPEAEGFDWDEDYEGIEKRMYQIPEDLCPICNGSIKPLLLEMTVKRLKHLNLTIEDLVEFTEH